MASYQSYLQEFQKHGLHEENTVTQTEIKRVLDAISAKNSGNYNFDETVANEIWEETQEKNAYGPIKLRDYIVTLVQAENILREQVHLLQSTSHFIQARPVKKPTGAKKRSCWLTSYRTPKTIR